MKRNIIKSLALGLLAVAGMGFAGCQDHFDEMNVEVPVATLRPNTTIAELKKAFWQTDASNYCDEVPAREDGEHYVIRGRVVSNDYYGNIFKCLYIQDETGVLPMSINQYNLYMTNRVGQEVVIDVTGMYIGKYAGMMQLGFPSWYDRDNTWQTSFMAPDMYELHRQYNGNPEPAKIDTVLVNDYSEISGSSPEELIKWQGQLVRFNNATFANGGTGATLCANYQTKVSDEQNQPLNVKGGTITVRTSGYAKFWNYKLPAEACDVVGLLGYYNGNWQLLLNDADGIMNVGNPTAIGTKDKPYSVAEMINMSNEGSASGWVKGYIVGTVAPEVTNVTSDNDITWTAPFIMDNTLVIADAPDVRDYTKCAIVPLTEGTALYQYGNLADNPALAGREISVEGRFGRSMNMANLAGNSGRPSSFEIAGVEVPSDEPKPGDGTEAAPYTVTQAIALGSTGKTAWVTGYIVGAMNTSDSNNYVFETSNFTVASNIYIAATPDETDRDKMMPVQLPIGDVRTAVNLKDHPENLGKIVSLNGSLESYFRQPGLKSVSAYKLAGGSDTPKPDVPSDAGTESKPYTVTQILSLGNPGTTSWVEGYIVGWSTNGTFSANFTADGAVTQNVLIAASKDEKDDAKLVPVQLPIGDVRNALNLQNNPGNLGKHVVLEGKLELFFNRVGIKSVSQFKL